MSDFVDFAGTADRRGNTVRLVAFGNNGAMEFAAQDVALENDRVAVRQGAMAIAIEEPGNGNLNDRPAAAALRAACPSGITSCIGSVHVCCDDFRVIGSCSGAWGCGRPRFIP
ncbi:hypothetical protein [Bradyrhizobium sp.]|uniref:hypothetical protein n=1 Tax=Bradyrhizobium sp. TaxID=376 RepID=UPI0027346B87|nr:hypothetical protein [Bradyrhizobium sp.]MDP3691235.1 hypothetical protein [Bradyrhizobium sp.]